MRTSGGIARRIGGAAAAYLIVLQAVLAGLTLGAQAAAPQADAFTILCADAANGDAGVPAGKSHGLPSCCVVGCVMLGAGMEPPPDLAFAIPEAALEDRDAAPSAFDAPARGAERGSKTSRAPPHAA